MNYKTNANGSISIDINENYIDPRAFEWNEKLETIKAESVIKEIGDYAFDGCESLESIKIPNRVTEIGDNIFNYCPKLKNVTILSTLQYKF